MEASRLQPERRRQAGQRRDVPRLEGRARESGAQDVGAGSDPGQNPLAVGEGDAARLGHEDRQLGRLDDVRVEGDIRTRHTLETSPTGNLWATPLRKLIDSGAIRVGDVALVGARNLDPPEEEFIRSQGVQVGEEGIARALDETACTYVAFDTDVLDPAELAVFMPEPDGLTLDEAERILGEIARSTHVLGAGLTAASFEPGNVLPLSRLTRALGL